MQPEKFYLEQQAIYEEELTKLSAKISMSSILRLIVFLTTIIGIYLFFSNSSTVLIIGSLGTVFFSYLLIRHTRLLHTRDIKQRLLEINETELQVLNGEFQHLDQGKEFIDPTHFYSYDIDLFGKGSFFQYINRTATREGKTKLAKQFTDNDVSNIIEKQSAIRELAEKPLWRQLFSARAGLVKVDYPTKNIVNWLHKYKCFVPSFVTWLPIVFSFVSLGLVILAFIQVVEFRYVVLWFFIGLGITGVYLKKINKLYENSSHAKDTFKQYYRLLEMIEQEAFQAEILQKEQQAIKTATEKASVIFAKFSKLLDAFDQRNNMMVGIVLNGLTLRDLRISYKIEKWIEKYHGNVEKWFDVITFFDAKNSLANATFNHPSYIFPTISPDEKILEAIKLGHPLIAADHRVSNDFKINDQQFFIITGANMAGKSTFLRTVSLAIVMANMGLPVCAKSFSYKPMKLITSMRTSDSLADDESYFFSELKRLKCIVDEIVKANYFIILDEILKGTNSKDKAIGSKKFVEKLVDSKSTGIIATHDLSLCKIEQELPQVKNCYFDAEIRNDELYFDYKLKTGVCKNMNASFLLKKMEIV